VLALECFSYLRVLGFIRGTRPIEEDSRQPDIIEKVKLKARLRNKGVLYSIVYRMPVYVSIASSYYKVGKLARTCRKHIERAER